MTQVYRTLRVTAADRGVLGVVMDAPPMNLIGPELVRDLVTLSGALNPVWRPGSWCWRAPNATGRPGRLNPHPLKRAEQIIGVAKAAIIYKISRDS